MQLANWSSQQHIYQRLGALSYPEVNVQVAGVAEFPVADLESDGHDIVLVELLVEAFSTVGRELDVVAQHGLQETSRC